MIKIYLIRHGKTAGNQERRYVGTTDEPLCAAGVEEMLARKKALYETFAAAGEYVPGQVYVSPMLRCRQSAKLLFPDAAQRVFADLREMDFGEFEYKNYAELAGDARYQAFIDSGGKTDFPGAEPQGTFRRRVCAAFARCIKETAGGASMANEPRTPLVFVVHGGTIMAVLEAYAVPYRDYFDWQATAAGGYCCELAWEEERLVLRDARRI